MEDKNIKKKIKNFNHEYRVLLQSACETDMETWC